jgi:hypothetical protein
LYLLLITKNKGTNPNQANIQILKLEKESERKIAEKTQRMQSLALDEQNELNKPNEPTGIICRNISYISFLSHKGRGHCGLL